MKKVVKLSPEMGAAVIERLSKFTDLPAAGYLAGQSVASAVSELFGDGRAVRYNDVDVFREGTPAELEAMRDSAWYEFSSREVARGYEGLNVTTYGRYTVLTSKRSGMLNEVLCANLTSDETAFLRTFDLNCVQVGVNLQTQELAWTPEFEAFMRTRELDIVNVQTPVHSLIRYFRKRKELEGVHGNDKRIIELVSALYQAMPKRSETEGPGGGLPASNYNFRWWFGDGYREKLESVAEDILPHFSLHTEVTEKSQVEVSTLVPRFSAGADLLNAASGLSTLPAMSRALREKHKPNRRAVLEYLVEHKESLARTGWLSFGDLFLKGGVTPVHIARMDAMTQEHAVEHQLLSPTLEQQWTRFKLLKSMVAKRGPWVYGVLENCSRRLSDAELPGYLDEQEALLTQTLKASSLPQLEVNGFVARELVTGMDLAAEGQELHHCVGGYASAVREGATRIISLRGGPASADWVTLQLAKSGPRARSGFWRVVQLKGVCNRRASDPELDAAVAYRALTNLAAVLGGRATGWAYGRSPQVTQRLANQVQGLIDRGHEVRVAKENLRRAWASKKYRFRSGGGLASLFGSKAQPTASNPFGQLNEDIPF